MKVPFSPASAALAAPAVLLAVVACGSSSAPRAAPPVSIPAATASAPALSSAAPAPDAPDPRETRLIARALTQVERARGLEATRPVPGVLLDRAALIAQVKEHVSRELPHEAIRNEGLTLQLLGFVPTEFDYGAAEYKLLQEQLAGYYEPADGTMYMASDLADDEAEATLAHELVHALQDQRWHLRERSKYHAGQGDRSGAVSALAEGDATSAMFDVMIAHASPGSGKTALDLPDDVFVDQIRQSMDQGPGAAAPHVMRSSLAAPYIYGTLFVHALRRRGGWEAVDRAWADPPATTEQIMHVEKWVAHEPAMAIEAPTFAALGAGWTAADEDSEGELGVRVAFEEWTDAARAERASVGWGGDRGVLVENGDRAAFAWTIRYDPGKTRESRAVDVYAAIARGIDQSIGPASVSDASFDCHERPDRGPLAIAVRGGDLVFVAGPARTPTSGAWASAGTCATARKWVKEIAAH